MSTAALMPASNKRRGRKVVQQTVAPLGELDAERRARAAQLAREISGRDAGRWQGDLFDSSAPVRRFKR